MKINRPLTKRTFCFYLIQHQVNYGQEKMPETLVIEGFDRLSALQERFPDWEIVDWTKFSSCYSGTNSKIGEQFIYSTSIRYEEDES